MKKLKEASNQISKMCSIPFEEATFQIKGGKATFIKAKALEGSIASESDHIELITSDFLKERGLELPEFDCGGAKDGKRTVKVEAV